MTADPCVAFKRDVVVEGAFHPHDREEAGVVREAVRGFDRRGVETCAIRSVADADEDARSQ
jgi:hypothetical protein